MTLLRITNFQKRVTKLLRLEFSLVKVLCPNSSQIKAILCDIFASSVTQDIVNGLEISNLKKKSETPLYIFFKFLNNIFAYMDGFLCEKIPVSVSGQFWNKKISWYKGGGWTLLVSPMTNCHVGVQALVIHELFICNSFTRIAKNGKNYNFQVKKAF